MTAEYEWDVAISLLDRDLDVAKRIASLFGDRVRVFLYSEEQRRLAGADGMESFTAVFRNDARTVLVLARVDWGKTRWTRIEETAIKNRGLAEGWDFVTVAPLDGRASVPDWIPATHIWAEIERLGESGLVAVLERKLRERGSAVRPETAEDLNARLEREAREGDARRAFLQSEAGVQAADDSHRALLAEVEGRAPALGMRVRKPSSGGVIITKHGVSLSLRWQKQYANSLRYSELLVRLWDGILSDDVALEYRAKSFVSELRMQFDTVAGLHGWRDDRANARFFSPSELSEHVLKALLSVASGQDGSL